MCVCVCVKSSTSDVNPNIDTRTTYIYALNVKHTTEHAEMEVWTDVLPARCEMFNSNQ